MSDSWRWTGGGAVGMLPMLAIFIAFYFMLIVPQRKQQKQHETMQKALKKGDLVRTEGGIRGEIFSLDERDVVLIVSDRMKLTVLRSKVAGLEPDVARATHAARQRYQPLGASGRQQQRRADRLKPQ